MAEPRILDCESVTLRGGHFLQLVTSGWIAILMFFASCTAGMVVLGGVAIFAAAGFTALVQVALHAAADRKRRGGRALLVDEGVHVFPTGAESVLVRRERVATGFEEPATSSVVIVLDDGREIALALPGDDEPEEVLEHLGVAVAQRSLSLPLRGTVGAGTWAFIGMAIGLVAGVIVDGAFDVGPLVPLALVAACAGTLGVWLGRPSVTIGVDGIRIKGALGARFVPFCEVESVGWSVPPGQGRGGGVIRVVARNRTIELPLYGAPHARVQSLRHRIEQAAERHAGGRARKVLSLGRAGRTVEAWRTEVKRVASADAGFRDAALGPADFERILADASAPADERIGAALALRVAAPEAAPSAIRVAMQTSADEALRGGLAATLDDDDPALDEATRQKA